MLVGLSIRDVVLIETLDLSMGPGLTALTGETGAGKSIVLDALGLALGAKAESGLVRTGAAQAVATAIFSLDPADPLFDLLDEKGLPADRTDDLILRRQLSADGRSRAFVNDQATSVGVLREIGTRLVEVHGQHETIGLLDPRSHRALLDAFAECQPQLAATAQAWAGLRVAREACEALEARVARAAAETELLTARLAELDRLAPRPGEEEALAQQRALLGAAEKAMADLAGAREQLGGDDLTRRLSGAFRGLERARERAQQAGVDADNAVLRRLSAAADAVDRALVEATEALASVDAAADAFEFDPARLEETEERLFALRAAARKLGVPVDELAAERTRIASDLRTVEDAEAELTAARKAVAAAEATYAAAAGRLREARIAAGARLADAVETELKFLKLERARFQVVVEPLSPERAGPTGHDRVEFQVCTNPGAAFGALGAIASGGELARFALAIKASLAQRGGADASGPAMIFDEVDQGVGGAVADAVGTRLRRLAAQGQQVLVVTHSPQVAARANQHWRVAKDGDATRIATTVTALDPSEREEEIARMLSGAEITTEARAAARALIAG
jgi:DNA repair protein RecN (Recombination protein N)